MAIRLDAVNDPLVRTTSLPPITTFSILCWAYLSVDRNSYSEVMTYGNNSSTFYQYGTKGDGTTLGSYNGSVEGTGVAWTVGTWKHLAMTVAGTGAGQFLCYQNGVVDTTLAGNASVTSVGLRLGTNFGTSSEWFNGRIAAVKIYDVALTQAAIVNEMRQYLPFRTANLNMWCPMLVHTDTKDYSGAGRTWTSDGGALATEDGPPIPWARQPSFARGGVGAAPPTGKAPPPFHRPWRTWRRAA
jgi:hypothetical protein